METVLYTVKPGDTLYAIAKRFCTTVNILARYNGLVDPDYIEAGQVLRIPVSAIPKPKAVPYREYIVKKGDTLTAIAEKSGVNYLVIAAYNALSDADVIQEGQVLKIPFPLPKDTKPLPSVTTSADTFSDGTQAAEGSDLTYTVQEGDTLYQIARRFGVSVPYLINRNRLCQPDKLRIGQTLILKQNPSEPV